MNREVDKIDTSDFDLPILLIAFNRPDLVKIMLARLKDLHVKRLYIAIDGPRSSNESDICASVKGIVETFRGDFQISLMYRDYNLGCNLGVVSALDWFFSRVPFGIVLEDDCYPEDGLLEFFGQCYENWISLKNRNIRLISGHNPIADASQDYTIETPLIWSWATDSSTWLNLRKDFFRYDFPRFKNNNGDRRSFPEIVFWWSNAMRARTSKVDTWDGIFSYRFWQLGYKTLVPKQNLVRNIGFDDRATHTKDPISSQLDLIFSAESSESFNALLKRNYFKIRTRHAITPLFRLLGDLKQGIKRKNFERLLLEDQQSRIELFFS